ncbi:MAG: anthranilate synthase component I, partial [Merismopedia sp. SIO2A8]|nr:anthranilate synthase component I [Merismopedia sp. SIO2A8]
MTIKQPLPLWHWRSLPLNHRTGMEIFQALYIDLERSLPKGAIATLLESPYTPPSTVPSSLASPTRLSTPSTSLPQPSSPTGHNPHSRYSICAGSPRIIDGMPQHWTPPMGAHLTTLDQLLARSPRDSPVLAQHSPPPPHLPFLGGWLGWLGYDVAWDIEHLPHKNHDPLPFPVSFWYEPDTFAILDHHEQVLWIAATQLNDLDRLQQQLSIPSVAPSSFRPSSSSSAPVFLTTPKDYEAIVNRAKAYIRSGDIFQANLSLRFSAQTSATSWMIYRALQQVNPSPFSSYWHTPWGSVVSCSPERLVKVYSAEPHSGGISPFTQGKRWVETRPIAGTRPRGQTLDADLAYAKELSCNPKENAEHIMLVDLERNDLGRVCEWGSVSVDELLTVERYSHVMHLVSNVVGVLDPSCSTIDVIRSLFPGGTITGCPKVRCMEIIEELEPVRRSLFYGSCGYLDYRGQLDLNILIRTLLCSDQTWSQDTDADDRNQDVIHHL